MALLGEAVDAPGSRLLPVCLTIMVAGPVSVAFVGYLWAIGEAGAVLRSTWLQIPFLLVVLLPLLTGDWRCRCRLRHSRGRRRRVGCPHPRGAQASRLHDHAPSGPPTASAIAAALAGGLLCWSMKPVRFVAALTGAVAAAAIYPGLLAIWHRSYLTDAVALASQGLRGAARPGSSGSTEGSFFGLMRLLPGDGAGRSPLNPRCRRRLMKRGERA